MHKVSQKTLPSFSSTYLMLKNIMTLKSTLGIIWAFSVTGAKVWNLLLDSLQDPALSSNSFRQSLKTNLFRRYHSAHTQGAVEMFHDYALYKSITYWHWQWQLYRLTSQSPADYQNLLLYTEYFSVIGRFSVCSALISRELTLPDEVSSIRYMRSETEFL